MKRARRSRAGCHAGQAQRRERIFRLSLTCSLEQRSTRRGVVWPQANDPNRCSTKPTMAPIAIVEHPLRFDHAPLRSRGRRCPVDVLLSCNAHGAEAPSVSPVGQSQLTSVTIDRAGAFFGTKRRPQWTLKQALTFHSRNYSDNRVNW